MFSTYPDVDAVLRGFLEGARSILGGRFVGLYLYGSLAAGDFSPDRSDIDFVVVTDGELSRVHLSALTEMHDHFASSDSPWATEVDGSYIPRDALRRHDPGRAGHPHVERGVGKLRVEHFGPDWVIQRHVLREHGVVLAGPAPRTLIDTVGPDDIRRAVRALALDVWAPLGEDPVELAHWHWGAQVYTILTMCRMLHTLETGEVVSKQAAARWARSALGPPWASLIDRALAWKKTDPRDAAAADAAATGALVRLVVERWRASS
jgi:hypothetical protein